MPEEQLPIRTKEDNARKMKVMEMATSLPYVKLLVVFETGFHALKAGLKLNI